MVDVFVCGALPGSRADAMEVMAGELAAPTIPTGPDYVAETLALTGLNFDRGPRRYELSPHGRSVSRHWRDGWAYYWDLLEEQWSGRYEDVAMLVCGPWTLAAGVELSNGHRVVSDRSATRDLHEEWHGAVAELRATACSRLGAALTVLIDEPSLEFLAAGGWADTHDFDNVPPVDEEFLHTDCADMWVRTPAARFVGGPLVVPWSRLEDTTGRDLLAARLAQSLPTAVENPPGPKELAHLWEDVGFDPELLTEVPLGVSAAWPDSLTVAADISRIRKCAEVIRAGGLG